MTSLGSDRQQEGILNGILCIGLPSKHPVGNMTGPLLRGLENALQGILVTIQGTGNEALLIYLE